MNGFRCSICNNIYATENNLTIYRSKFHRKILGVKNIN